MTNKSVPLAAAVIATALLGGSAVAQSAAPASSSQSAKPSPYQGVSNPPTSDVITTSDEPQAQPAAPPVKVEPKVESVTSTPVTPPPDSASVAPSPELKADEPVLRAKASKSSEDPDAGIVTYVPGPANALPEGTVFRVRMLQNVMASDVTPGTPFRAKLSQDLVHNGRIVVPMGSELHGKVVYATHGRRISGASVIHLRPDEFVLPDGSHYHLHAIAIDTQGSDTKATGEGNIAQKQHGKRALVEMGIGTGGGALIGATLGGPTGAAVGSVVGAGVMGAHLLLANQAVDLPEESTVVFSLTEPMFLTPTRD